MMNTRSLWIDSYLIMSFSDHPFLSQAVDLTPLIAAGE
jgi:hypothetical protein